MSDIGPRRSMDMMRTHRAPNLQPTEQPASPEPVRKAAPPPRPVAARPMPTQQTATRPVSTPMQRPAMQPRPVVRPQGQQARQQQSPQPAQTQPMPVQEQQRPVRRKAARASRGWWIVLQFVIGLAVIVGVAAAIVILYVKYYQ